MSYEGDAYVILFRGGETRRVPFASGDVRVEAAVGDPELDRVKQAVREVLGDEGWLDVDLELGKRWVGGTLRLIPGKEGTQPKDVPLEMFFKKIVAVRDRLRVLEQKVNSHSTLAPEEKLELQGYISRCYGSLTTFNVLFGAVESQFKGQADRDG
jgi:hypothetical protein